MVKLVSILMLAVMAGCIRGAQPAASQPETTLRVENRNFLDMNIYLIRQSETTRLGTALGHSTTVLKIPARALFGPTPLRFQARPIAGTRQPVTEEIIVNAGDEVLMIIPPG